MQPYNTLRAFCRKKTTYTLSKQVSKQERPNQLIPPRLRQDKHLLLLLLQPPLTSDQPAPASLHRQRPRLRVSWVYVPGLEEEEELPSACPVPKEPESQSTSCSNQTRLCSASLEEPKLPGDTTHQQNPTDSPSGISCSASLKS